MPTIPKTRPDKNLINNPLNKLKIFYILPLLINTSTCFQNMLIYIAMSKKWFIYKYYKLIATISYKCILVISSYTILTNWFAHIYQVFLKTWAIYIYHTIPFIITGVFGVATIAPSIFDIYKGYKLSINSNIEITIPIRMYIVDYQILVYGFPACLVFALMYGYYYHHKFGQFPDWRSLKLW